MGCTKRLLATSCWLLASEGNAGLVAIDEPRVLFNDHERSCVTKRVRRLENLHPRAVELRIQLVKIVDRECDVIEHLAASRNELLLAALGADALSRVLLLAYNAGGIDSTEAA